jgi:hypothetical protein
MTLRLNGSTSGYTEIDAPAVAGSNTLVLPTGDGSAGNILGTDGAGNLSWVNGRMVLATAQNTTSGTSIDFTGIPSWAKKITVMFQGVSTSGTSAFLIQIGTSAGVTTSGYSSAGSNIGTSSTNVTGSTAGFILIAGGDAATTLYDGLVTVSLINASSNAWVSAGTLRRSTNNAVHTSGGNVTLSSTLDRVRITTVNGTDTFDAGSINILYEG